MASVLPRRKKRVDIFAPRKSVQDAKEMLGPAFFDPTLIECSRNAVALTKLVNKLEKIDKEQVRRMRDITREQHILIRSSKRNRSYHSLNESPSKYTSSECTATLDCKPNPPGFRFKTNGEMKPSATSLSHCNITDSDEDLNITLAKSKCFARDLSIASRSSYVHRICLEDAERMTNTSDDYHKEIETLGCAIVDICNELSNSKISLSESNSGTFKQFLRADSNEYNGTTNEAIGGPCRSPNDRFTFQSGSAERQNLHKQTIRTPFTRSCTACQFKLKQKSDDLQMAALRQDHDIQKQRWCYVPTGTYVQSSTALAPSTSVSSNTAQFSSHSVEHNGDIDRIDIPKLSTVNLKLESEIQPTKLALKPRHSARAQSHLNRRTQSSRDVRQVVSARGRVSIQDSAHSIVPTYKHKHQCTPASESLGIRTGTSLPSTAYCKGRSLTSSVSCGSSNLSSQSLAAFDSRMNMMRKLQADQKDQCDSKVKRFLEQLDLSST